MQKTKDKEIKKLYGVGVTDDIASYNGKTLRSYNTWRNMLRRCYDVKYQARPTYKGCTVCEQWHSYKNFKAWYKANYYEIEGQRMEIDKDIIQKGNKIYSPQTCVFVPTCINSLFIKCNATRGDLPVGVSINKRSDYRKYQVHCQIFQLDSATSKHTGIGCFPTINQAFIAYKITKEANIKLVANYYKEQIPNELYDAMMTYEVNIDD